MQRPPMTAWHLIVRSLAYHGRTHAAVALGVMAATTVLVGALVVGDSVRGSLAHLALDRLGRIDDVLVTDHFFPRDLADRLAKSPGFPPGLSAVPVILVPGNLKHSVSDRTHRASEVTIIGCSSLGSLGSGGPPDPIPPGQIVLNQPLADALAAKPGDEVLVQIGRADLIPPDSPLGRKTETTRSRRLSVAAVIPAEGLGRFGLRPTQQLPQNAFVAAETLAEMLDRSGKVNALLVAGPAGEPPDAGRDLQIEGALKPTLADCGFSLVEVRPGCWQLAAERLLIDRTAERSLLADLAADHPQPILTYLANTLRVGQRGIPYSTVAAIDFATKPPLGPFDDSEEKPVAPLADGEIALNSWAAEDLGAKIGDDVEIVFFEPESTHGDVRERTATLRLAAILPLSGAAADRHLTPDLPGVTDQTSIADWDPPFPFDAKRVRKKDEAYWDQYRATPKAFVSLATGRRLWASRFGQSTAIRFATDPGATAAEIENRLHLDPVAFGLRFVPIRSLALAASSGTTPFSVLFLSFSFFIIVAALLLVALLFGLGLDQRASQIGVLLAVGMREKRLIRLLSVEGLLVATVGSLLGVAGGVAYAWLMVAALRTWWLGAISTPFLMLHVGVLSLLLGTVIGIVVTAATIYVVARRMRRVTVCRLLAGQPAEAATLNPRRRRLLSRVAGGLLVLAIVVGFASARLGSTAQAGGFFGCGLLMLLALVLGVHAFLCREVWSSPDDRALARLSIRGLASRNLARHPARASLSIGLVAAASFLIVATNVFRLDPASETGDRRTGSGGFALLAQSDQPIYADLGSSAGRAELGFSTADSNRLTQSQFFSLRVRAGDDASCLNLYQATNPRILGVPKGLVDRGGFAWAASAAESPAERGNPWLLLDRELPASADGVRPVPVVLDMNTAQYSLHLYQGVGQTYDVTGPDGQPIRFQVVGMLRNSIFQGDLLISEQEFLAHFPQTSGYRYFLVDVPPAEAAAVAGVLDDTLEDYGFDARGAASRLAELMVVQNTYLSTFQALGGLGLVLGTLGLAAVELRSVLERRGELALMQAVGFRRRRLGAMVLWEHALLLISGLAVGAVSALVAVWPHLAGGAGAVPWLATAATLALVLVVGLAAGLFAVRAVLAAKLLPALRAE
jgi:ABC-type antimicrobial peptide transport system permease subunit